MVFSCNNLFLAVITQGLNCYGEYENNTVTSQLFLIFRTEVCFQKETGKVSFVM